MKTNMIPALYTATDCARCHIVKTFMTEHGLPFEEFDIRAQGRTAFNRFYRGHHRSIHRGEQGIEFPIWADGKTVKQGVGVVLAWLQAGTRLDGWVAVSSLGHGWIDGLNLSGGSSAAGNDFLVVLRYLKQHGLKTELTADGRNPGVLEQAVSEGMIDSLIFTLLGPPPIYIDLPDRPINEDQLRQSLALVTQIPQYRVVLRIGPVERKKAQTSYLTPEEAAAAAALAAATTGDRRLPFFVQIVDPPRNSNVVLPPATAAFRYRTAVRRHMLAAEILKPVVR